MGARGTAHAYDNRAKEPLRLLIQLIPGGTEELFAEMGAYLQTVDGAPDEKVTAAIMAATAAPASARPSPFRESKACATLLRVTAARPFPGSA